MSTAIAAYAFRSGSQANDMAGAAEAPFGVESGAGSCILTFPTGQDCRNTVRSSDIQLQVIVTEAACDVAPMNLVAALHADAPERDVYLLAEEPSASLLSRTIAAGARGIINSRQMHALMGITCPGDGTDDAKEPPALLPALLPEAASAAQPEAASDAQPEAASAAQPEAASAAQPDVAVLATHAAESDMGHAEAPDIMTEATRAAAYEAFSAPLLLKSTGHSSERHPETAAGPGRGMAVAFVSGRGGVGKSSLSLLAATLLQKRGLAVTLVDLDLQFGDLGYMSGRIPEGAIRRTSLAEAVQGGRQSGPTPGCMSLIEAPQRPEQAEEYMGAINGLIENAKQASDIVIVNAGSFWTELQAIVSQCADRLVFVMDQRATSIRGCQQAVDLCMRLQIPTVRFAYLLNRCSRGAALTDLDVSMALGGVDVMTISDGGPIVDEMLSLGAPHELLEANAAFAASFDRLVGYLLAANDRLALKSSLALQQPAQKQSALGGISDIFSGRRRGGSRVAS